EARPISERSKASALHFRGHLTAGEPSGPTMGARVLRRIRPIGMGWLRGCDGSSRRRDRALTHSANMHAKCCWTTSRIHLAHEVTTMTMKVTKRVAMALDRIANWKQIDPLTPGLLYECLSLGLVEFDGGEQVLTPAGAEIARAFKDQAEAARAKR